jgi:hypothetical protein
VSNSQELWIRDKYIAPLVLPKEKFHLWLKYDTSLDFDTISLVHSPDFNINWIGNTNEVIKRADDGIITCSRKELFSDGFIFFVCEYQSIPEEEKEEKFIIEFRSADKTVKSLELVTKIVRPIVVQRSINYDSISIEGYSPDILEPLDLEFENIGSALPKNFTLNMAITSPTLKIAIDSFENEVVDGRIFKEKIKTINNKIRISGKGQGMITLKMQYEDMIGNKYESIVGYVTIQSMESKQTELPVFRRQAGPQPRLLVVPQAV